MIKGFIYQENTTILKVYALTNKAAKYLKQKLTQLKREIFESPVVVENFNILLSIIDSTKRPKKSEGMYTIWTILLQTILWTILCLDPNDIYRMLPPTKAICTFSSTCGTFI